MGEEPVVTRAVDPLATEAPSTEGYPAAIRAGIEATRAEMSGTIDALQDKLSPQRIMDEAKHAVHDATVGKVTTMMNTVTEKAADVGGQMQDQAQQVASYVRQNPVPALLVGAGITWLLMRSRNGQPASSGYSSYSGAAGSTGDRTPRSSAPSSGLTAGWAETASGAAGHVQQRVSSYGRKAETTIERWLRENPLTVGTVALAAGALVGLGLPRTETEDAWMGEARDTVVERAQKTANDAVDRVGEIADQVEEKVDEGAHGAMDDDGGEPRREPVVLVAGH